MINQDEFIKKWESEKSLYEAWGKYIINQLESYLSSQEIDPKVFFKIFPKERTKENNSLIDKAFVRKQYQDPYNDVEDKVGVRFVVLLTEDLKKVCEFIEACGSWVAVAARDYEQEKEREPLLFAYQSMHYILRPQEPIEYNNFIIPAATPCEVQVRTLLQHAHAELTHDAIYKSKKDVKPKVHRTVAKCMALIETTDSFFSEAIRDLHSGPLLDYKVIEKLDSLYVSFIELQPHNQKSSLIVFDAFESFITEDIIDKIYVLINENLFLKRRIKDRYSVFNIYQQSVIFFIYWLIDNRIKRVSQEWPLDYKILELLATDLGKSLEN